MSGVSGGVLTIVGPALEGEYIPRGGTGGANIPVRGIHGGVTAGARTIAGGAVSALRGGIVGVAATAAMAMALDKIGGFIDENGKPVIKKPQGEVPIDVFGYRSSAWSFCNTSIYPSPMGYMACAQPRIESYVSSTISYSLQPAPNNNGYRVIWTNNKTGQESQFYVEAVGKCPGVLIDSTCYQEEVISPFTGPDYDNLTDTLSGVTNPDWLKSLLEASCEGSLSPGRCYDELTSLADQLKGPSSVKGPSSSTTSTYTRPDGTTGTTNTTTETNYTINYGPNYFDYSKTTTTTTSKDGEKPTTTTETESPEVAGEEPATEPESQTPSPCTTNCEGPAYEDQYKPTEETKESVIDNYLSRVEQAPIVNAATGFFDVSVSASCPTWQAPVDMSIMGASFHSELVFDHHCQPWFTGYRTAAMAVVMILCAFGAFYIAMLD
ncbi:hypothetical protein N0786_25860 [Pseudomonas aeruginosa]|nr:hypothetical protein [Pseudomonas aeruginosa]MCS7673083.1 hypothetical protein [Pseudomonas aeruginosa]MCS9865108.1 hypothetical protein [Pseudomonas aeruginosa]MCS9865120.1 hypothetical protein [Pseudomonas aeruginosa]